MIVAEQKILGRGKSTFTAVVGYAGGTKLGQENKANTPTTRKVIVRDFASKHTDDFRRHMGLGLSILDVGGWILGLDAGLSYVVRPKRDQHQGPKSNLQRPESKFRSLKPAEIGCTGALRFENFCQGVLPQHDG
jgi:hypothetical protein